MPAAARQGRFAARRNLDEHLSRHAFFFIKINDNSVVYLQLQLLSDAAGCRWLAARGEKVDFVVVSGTNPFELWRLAQMN